MFPLSPTLDLMYALPIELNTCINLDDSNENRVLIASIYLHVSPQITGVSFQNTPFGPLYNSPYHGDAILYLDLQVLFYVRIKVIQWNTMTVMLKDSIQQNMFFE